MNIILKRNVKLHCYHILIDMGVQTSDRPDIVSVTKRASELGGSITSKAICRDLINRPDALSAGENILRRCQDLYLLDEHGSLTDEGHRTAEEETVFIPERGTYRAWFTTDPLLPQTLVSIQPWNDGPLRGDVYSNGNNKDKSNDPDFLPEWVTDIKGREIRMLGDSTLRKIYSMEDIGRRINDHPLSIELTLSVSQFGPPSLVAKSSKWEEELMVSDLPFPIQFDEIWSSLLEERHKDWNGAHLQSSYDGLSDPERLRFRTDISCKKPSFENLGSFSDTTVREVSIAPRSLHDAEQWSQYLLSRRIDTYLNPDEYARVTEEIRNRDEFGYVVDSLSLPSQEILSSNSSPLLI